MVRWHLNCPATTTRLEAALEDYPQIFANTADVDGGVLVVRPSSANGLYEGDYAYEDVITADVGTGTFANTSTTNSLFLDLDIEYGDSWDDALDNTDDTIDLTVSRVAFDDAASA